VFFCVAKKHPCRFALGGNLLPTWCKCLRGGFAGKAKEKQGNLYTERSKKTPVPVCRGSEAKRNDRVQMPRGVTKASQRKGRKTCRLSFAKNTRAGTQRSCQPVMAGPSCQRRHAGKTHQGKAKGRRGDCGKFTLYPYIFNA